jgi:uroporphyrinogen decarboxylase
LIEAGFACLNPLEVKAGMDLAQLKREYGDVMTFMGGIDARTMGAPDPQEIEREIERKLAVGMEGGGYIYHSDHSVPDDVSWERYNTIMALVKQYGIYGRE